LDGTSFHNGPFFLSSGYALEERQVGEMEPMSEGQQLAAAVVAGIGGFVVMVHVIVGAVVQAGVKPGLEDVRESLYKQLVQIIADTRIDLSSPMTAEDVRTRLWNMITYAAGRHDYYERARRDFLTIGLGLLGAATALEAFLFRLTGDKPWFLVGGGILIGLTGVGLVFRYIYETSPDYPYRNVADIRSWYHHYNLPDSATFAVSPAKDVLEKQQASTRDSLKRFAERWLASAAPGETAKFIAEDLEQVFILFVLQQYKRVFIRKMGVILIAGITVFTALLISQVIVLTYPIFNMMLGGFCAGLAAGGLFGSCVQYAQ
jgi:hypothetical protein